MLQLVLTFLPLKIISFETKNTYERNFYAGNQRLLELKTAELNNSH